jgi:hypothetical protein
MYQLCTTCVSNPGKKAFFILPAISPGTKHLDLGRFHNIFKIFSVIEIIWITHTHQASVTNTTRDTTNPAHTQHRTGKLPARPPKTQNIRANGQQ